MINENFSKRNSWLHKLDPRVKIVIALMFSFLLALSNNILMLSIALVMALILILTANLRVKDVLKRLLLVNIFIVFIWAFIPFTYPGEVVAQIGFLSASREGILYSLKISLRSNTIIILLINLLSTSSVSALIHAMHHLYLPDKLIYLFFFVYRYLHVIAFEFRKLHNSMLLRGFKPKTNLHTYKSYAYLITFLLIKSYDRSQKVYEAMICRGFNGKFYIMDDFSIKKVEIIFSTFSFLIMIFLILIERRILPL